MMKKKLLLCCALAISIFGINMTVNAQTYVVDKVPDKFTTNKAGRTFLNGELDVTSDAIMANTDIGKHGQMIIDYHTIISTDSPKQLKIFCYDRSVSYQANSNYKKTDEAVDYPVVYIIANSENAYKKLGVNGVSSENQALEQSWMTQAAIWRYQNYNNFNSIKIEDNSIFEDAVTGSTGQVPTVTPTDESSSIITEVKYSDRAIKLWEAAGELAAEAKKAVDPSSISALTFNYDGKIEVNKESKIIKTSIITLQTEGISSYSIGLTGAPAGTKVYTQDGKEIADLNNISVKSFYLVIPIDNINNYAYDFNISVKSNGYTFYKGYKYVSDLITKGDGNVNVPTSNQPMVLITKATKELNASINVKGSAIENTGISIANSIYFVGFLILITGMGIIYANVKTKKEQV